MGDPISGRKSMLRTQHLYSGKVFEIWAAWQEDTPENYSLGATRQAAIDLFELQVQVVSEPFGRGPDGSVTSWRAWNINEPEFYGEGPTRMSAEKEVERRLAVRMGRINWQKIAIDMLILFMKMFPLDCYGIPEDELPIVRRAIDRELVARSMDEPSIRDRVDSTISRIIRAAEDQRDSGGPTGP